jgi:predicted ATPase
MMRAKPAFDGQSRSAASRERGSLSFVLQQASRGLWSDRGRNAEARDLLAPIYGWFTEGFGTLDLKEAKILLDALAP